jgi:hypothetical protein
MSCQDEIIINQNTTQNNVVVDETTVNQLIEINSSGSLVVSVNGQIGVVVLTPSSIGLDNVDNTSDLNKPISNATLSALLLKADLSAFNILNNFISANYGGWNNATITVNTLSANWNFAYNTATVLPTISALLTPLTLTNTLTSQLVKTTDLNSLSATLLTRTDYSSSSATFLPTTVYQNTSGSFITAPLGDTRYSKLSSQVYISGSGVGSIQPVSGNNIASGYYSSILGGQNNNTNGLSATFILGTGITAISADTTYVNNLSTTNSVFTESIIGSGTSEVIIGDGTSECSMGNNTLNLNFSCGVFINGRSISTISGTTSPYVTGGATGSIHPLSGGNTASGYFSNIGGGCSNQAENTFTTVAGGKNNIASGYASFTGSGVYNCSQSAGAVVVGGYYNTSSGTYASIVGGCHNNLTGSMSFIGGGYGNCDNGHNNVFILGSGIVAPQSNTTYTNNLSTGGTVYAKEVDAGTLSSAYLLGGGSEVVISDGSSDTGNGNSTLSLNFLSGVYASSSLTVGASGSANITINQTPTTFTNPVTASGQFLIVNINGSNKALQLWDYSS